METDTTSLELHQIASSSRAYIEASAGCGKTYSIADLVGRSTCKSLILTHTNRGVHAIKSRLRKSLVPSSKYNLMTLDSFMLTLVSSYPSLSGLDTSICPEDISYWKHVRLSTKRLFSSGTIKKIMEASFGEVFVDEVQDCDIEQFEIIKILGTWLPLRIFGDPLQSIFDFRDTKLIDLNHVKKDGGFSEHALSVPYRWFNTNPELGKWLLNVRESLIKENKVDLTDVPSFVNVIILGDDPNENNKSLVNHCYKMLQEKSTAFVLYKVRDQSHTLAKNLGGLYQSDEEIQSKSLYEYGHALSGDALHRWQATLKLIYSCLTTLNNFKSCIYNPLVLEGKYPRSRVYSEISSLLSTGSSNAQHLELFNILEVLSSNYNVGKIYRRELWEDAKHLLSLSDDCDLIQEVGNIRSRRSTIGRLLPSHLVSRILLVKGLECSHVVIADADSIDGKEEFYVALTRAQNKVTIFTHNKDKVFHFRKKEVKSVPIQSGLFD